MSTYFYYKLALSISETDMIYLTAAERLEALYAMLAHAQEAEEKQNEKLAKIYGTEYKPIYSQWPDKIDDLISRFRIHNSDELAHLEKEAMKTADNDAEAKVYE